MKYQKAKDKKDKLITEPSVQDCLEARKKNYQNVQVGFSTFLPPYISFITQIYTLACRQGT